MSLVQTRSEETGIAFHPTLEDAFEAAAQDETIWKISWTVFETAERVRLVKFEHSELPGRSDADWLYQPIRVMSGGEDGRTD